MAAQTPRRALPDARADNTSESPVLIVPTRFERARTVYELVSDVVTPQRIGLVLAALVLLVAGIAGGFDAVSAADDDTPTAAVGEVVDAAPFEITIKRARYGTELKPIAYRQDGRRHLFVTLDVRSKDRLPVPAGILLNAVRIDARNSRRRWPRAGSRACSLRRARPARQNKARIMAISVAATR